MYYVIAYREGMDYDHKYDEGPIESIFIQDVYYTEESIILDVNRLAELAAKNMLDDISNYNFEYFLNDRENRINEVFERNRYNYIINFTSIEMNKQYDKEYDKEFVRDDIEENSKKYDQMFLNKLKEAFDKLVEAKVEKVSLHKQQQKELEKNQEYENFLKLKAKYEGL